MAKLDDQISNLQEKLTRLKLRQQRLDSRQRAIAALRERKVETRRKVLLGGVVMARMLHSESEHQQVLGWLNLALTRAADRALFGLPTTDGVDLPQGA